MRRVVSLWLPTWPTDRLRRHGLHGLPASAPLVTRAHDGRRLVVAAADAAARKLGLHEGMPLAQAQALVSGLTIAEADPAGDAAALAGLAGWCLRYTPLTAADAPAGVWLDVTGCTHLAGGEAALLADLVGRLSRAGLEARAALADTPGAAHALARFAAAPTAIAAPGRAAACLAPLPVAALRLDAASLRLLRRLGLETVGALMGAPRGPFTRRFGPDLLRRLDQALGREAEPIAPVTPPAAIQHRLGFAEPLLTAEALAAAIAALAEAVCTRLEQAGQGALRLDLLFERVDGTVQALRIGTSQPNRTPRHLARLFGERLETVDPGLGVEAMRLVAVLAGELVAHNPSCPGLARASTTFLAGSKDVDGRAKPGHDVALDDPSTPPVFTLVDCLQNRFGEEQVFQVEPVESDIPERSVRQTTPVPPVPVIARSARSAGRSNPPRAGDCFAALAMTSRPSRLFRAPQPVQALSVLPDHPPAAFVWRRVRHRVRRADGPERITGEWWRDAREAALVRDYWAVEDEAGRRFWLFRSGDGSDPATGDLAWYLHGLF